MGQTVPDKMKAFQGLFSKFVLLGPFQGIQWYDIDGSVPVGISGFDFGVCSLLVCNLSVRFKSRVQ